MFSGTTYWCTYYQIIADKTFKLKEGTYSLNEIRTLILDKKIIVKNADETNRYADEKSYNDYEKINENKTEDFIFDNYLHHIREDFNNLSVFKNYYTDVFNTIRNNLSLKQIKQDAVSYRNQFNEKIEEVISYFDKKSKNIEKELAKFKFYIKTSEKTLAKMKESNNIETIEEVEIVL